MKPAPNPALNPAPFSRWTLRDKAAQRRLALRYALILSLLIMTKQQKPLIYREFIDSLVGMCQRGQGQIGAKRAQSGVWNKNATPQFIPEQHRINLLLAGLSAEHRQTISTMLANEVQVGVFETLKALEQFKIEPFVDGYEGSPFQDFIGRLAGWEWPGDES